MSDGANALLLEDNRQMQYLMRIMLREFGISKVLSAATISEAKDISKSNRLDLILVDQLLQSGGSGLDFVRWIRQSDRADLNMLPIITVSSFAETSRIIEAINAGVDEFLVKPLKPQDLFNRIRLITQRRRPFIRTSDYFGPCRRRLNFPNFDGPYRRHDDAENANTMSVIEL